MKYMSNFLFRIDPAEQPAYPFAGSYFAMPISSCLQMKKVYKVGGIHHPKAKKRKLSMPYATAITSLQAQPGPASHENAFPDA
jgi:hypothetical protein